MADNPLPKLSPKHQMFVSKYLELWNATRAYMAAYPGASEESARRLGAQLLSNIDIKAHIEARLSEIHMSADEAMQRMSDIAKARITDFYVGDGNDLDLSLFETDVDGNLIPKRGAGLIKRIKIKRSSTQFGESVETELELHNAQRAQEKILEINGKFGSLTKEPVGKGGIDDKAFSLPADVLARDFVDAYRDIKNGKHTEYLFYGGRGSTKSSFISLAIIYLLINNPNMHALAARQVANTLRDSVYAQLQWAIGELGLSDSFKCITTPMEIEYLPTHQKIYFRGLDDPGKVKSIKPTFGYLGLFWAEEIDQMASAEAVRKVEQSLRGGNTMYFFKSWNPPRSSQNWINKYVLVPKENQYQHTSNYLSVPKEWLGDVFIAEAEHLKTANPKAYANEYMGEVTGTGGQVFENVILREITDDEIYGKTNSFGQVEGGFDQVYHGLDFGYTIDPSHYSRCYYNSAQRVLYIFGELRKWKSSNEDLYNAIVEYGYQNSDLLICDSSEPKSVGDFRQFGAYARGAEKGAGSVRYSMRWLENLTSIVIDPTRCPYTADEFISAEYQQNSHGEYISEYMDTNNHAIDSVRYALSLVWRKRGQ